MTERGYKVIFVPKAATELINAGLNKQSFESVVDFQKNIMSLQIEKEKIYEEAAKILHSSPNYVYKLIEKGYLPAIKLGSIKVLKSSLETFLIENEGKDFSNLDDVKQFKLSSIKEIDNG